MALSAGWTLEYVGNNIDLPTLQTLTSYWEKHPPMHILLAAHVGYKAPAPASTTSSVEQDQALANIIATAPKYQFNPPAITYHGD